MPVKTRHAWLPALESAAVRSVLDDRRPVPSSEELKALAQKSKVRIPAGTDMAAVQRSVAKLVVLVARTAAVRIPGRTIAGKKTTGRPTTKTAFRLVALRERNGWQRADAARAFGVAPRVYASWEAGGGMNGIQLLLLTRYESVGSGRKALRPKRRSLAKPVGEPPRTIQGRRLFALRAKLGWAPDDVARAFGTNTRLVTLWESGAMPMRDAAWKVLALLELDAGLV